MSVFHERFIVNGDFGLANDVRVDGFPTALLSWPNAQGRTQMAQGSEHGLLEEFEEIVKPHEALAPYTYLKVGGPAEMLIQPRSVEELSGVVRACFQKKIALRVLGGGCNILVRDEGVRGAVLRLSEPAFSQTKVQGKQGR